MPSSTRKRPSPHSLTIDSSHDYSAEESFRATSRPGLASRILELIQLSDSRQLASRHALDSSVSCESFDSFNSFDSFDSNEYLGLDCRIPGSSVAKSMKIESLGKNYPSLPPPLSTPLYLAGSRENFDQENFDDLSFLAKTSFGGYSLLPNKAKESLPVFSRSENGGAVGASILSMESGLGRGEGEYFSMDGLRGHSISTAGGAEVSTASHGMTAGGVSVVDVGAAGNMTAGNDVSLDSVVTAGDFGTTTDVGAAGWSTTGIELDELREMLFRDETDFIAANSSESWLEGEGSHGLEHEISFSSSQVLPIGWDYSTDPENVNVEAARVLQEANALFSNVMENYMEAGHSNVARGRGCSGEQYGDIWIIEEKSVFGEGMGGIVLERDRDKDSEVGFTAMAPVLNSEHTFNSGVKHQTHNRDLKDGISNLNKLIQPSNLLSNSKKMTEISSYSARQVIPSPLECSSDLKHGLKGNMSTNCNSDLHSESDVMEKEASLEGGLNKTPKNENDMSLEFVLDPSWRPTSSHMEQLLVSCADAVNSDDVKAAYNIMQTLNCMVSQHGTAEQRMTYYFLEGLAARIVGTGSEIYLALQSRSGTEPGSTSKDMLAALLVFLEACPYANFGHEAANGAILEAFQGESNVHIIDFGITHGTQWPTLIEALAMRPEGPPKLRITGIDAPQTGLKPSSMQETGRRLSSFSRLMGVPFEFNAVTEDLEDLQAEQFDVREGEALAVSCVLRLHQLRDENKRLDGPSPRNTTLKMIRSLNPKVVTLVEQHTDHNLHSFTARVREAIHYYRALFDSLDVSLPWNSTERVLIEERVLGRKIVNIIACEGKERVERHESCDRWHFRMKRAGFKPKALSMDVVDSLQSLLKRYRDGYSLDQEGMAVLLTWQNQRLLAASTWECTGGEA